MECNQTSETVTIHPFKFGLVLLWNRMPLAVCSIVKVSLNLNFAVFLLRRTVHELLHAAVAWQRAAGGGAHHRWQHSWRADDRHVGQQAAQPRPAQAAGAGGVLAARPQPGAQPAHSRPRPRRPQGPAHRGDCPPRQSRLQRIQGAQQLHQVTTSVLRLALLVELPNRDLAFNWILWLGIKSYQVIYLSNSLRNTCEEYTELLTVSIGFYRVLSYSSDNVNKESLTLFEVLWSFSQRPSSH